MGNKLPNFDDVVRAVADSPAAAETFLRSSAGDGQVDVQQAVEAPAFGTPLCTSHEAPFAHRVEMLFSRAMSDVVAPKDAIAEITRIHAAALRAAPVQQQEPVARLSPQQVAALARTVHTLAEEGYVLCDRPGDEARIAARISGTIELYAPPAAPPAQAAPGERERALEQRVSDLRAAVERAISEVDELREADWEETEPTEGLRQISHHLLGTLIHDDATAGLVCGTCGALLRTHSHADWCATAPDPAHAAMSSPASTPAEEHAGALPDVLFEGWRVYEALDDRRKSRTSPENVADVLDALTWLLAFRPRASPPIQQGEVENG